MKVKYLFLFLFILLKEPISFDIGSSISLLQEITNYLPLTVVLNFLPAENTGTVLAGILIALPVCGFLPFLAALLRGSKVPKPTKVTFLPLATVFCTVSIKADKTSLASFNLLSSPLVNSNLILY